MKMLVLRPSLVRRLRALEKKLKVRLEDRCRCEGELRKANSVSVVAERLYTADSSLKLDAKGRPIKSSEVGVRAYFSKVADGRQMSAEMENKSNVCCPSFAGISLLIYDQSKDISAGWRWKGKSLWRGVDGNEVNVETRALQYYEGLGYKG